jgi:RNA recognition motif-containing protein
MADSTESSTPTTQRQQPAWRSQASMNWRAKDDSPRVERQSPAPSTRGGQSRFSNRSDGAQPQAGSDASGNASRLYVGNLLYTAQKADIETLFTDKGFNVVNVSISTDPFTGRNPSYCFVDLDSPDEAQRAIAELNGVDVMGRSLRVSPGVAKRNSAAQGGPGRGQEDSPDGGREVRVKNFERGWGRESREERSKSWSISSSLLCELDTPS